MILPHKKGFLTTRLRTLLRKKDNTSLCRKTLISTCTVPVDDPGTTKLRAYDKNKVDEAINFMKHSSSKDEECLKEKIEETFAYRRENGCTPEMFPRFLDTKGLVSYWCILLSCNFT